jgi:2-oxoglutarate ferredoxin oxidoreductase subunit gamma
VYFDVIISGFGGQGVLFFGNVLAQAAMDEGRYVTCMPSYGAEKRGGTANCTVVVSDQEIGSPLVKYPLVLAAMNKPSLAKFGLNVKKGGVIMYNASLVDETDVKEVQNLGVEMVAVAATQKAEELGNRNVANMVMLGALVTCTNVVSVDSAVSALDIQVPSRHKGLLPLNREAIYTGSKMAHNINMCGRI